MDKRKNEALLRIVKQEIFPALGCTEPAAVALSAAIARKFVSGDIKRIEVTTDRNVYKNGARVTIPGTKEKGLHIAAALGAVAGDPDKGLEVLRGVSQDNINLAKKCVEQGNVFVNIDKNKRMLYISTKIITSEGYSICTIERGHTNIVYIEANKRIIKNEKNKAKKGSSKDEATISEVQKFSLEDFKEFSDNVPLEDVAFIKSAIDMNLQLAEIGLKNPKNWGYILYKDLLGKGLNPQKSLMHYPVILAMSAVYERMAGTKEPVMALTGSGDQGLTAILPLIAIKKIESMSEEKLIRSILFTYLLSIYCRSYIGVLSAVCSAGSIVSSALSGGIVYMMGGTLEETEMAVKNTLISTAGMICDGAKASCTLKVATGVSTALYNALLAESHIAIPCSEGISSKDLKGTIQNVSYLVKNGFKAVDKDIVKILLGAEESGC